MLFINAILRELLSGMTSVAKARGTVDDAASLEPFMAVAPPDAPGYPFGYIEGGGRWLFDPLELQRGRFIGGPAWLVMGDRDKAKTSAFKEYGLFISSSDVGGYRAARTGAAIVRRNAGSNEWDEFARFFGIEPVDMMEAELNALSRGTLLPVSRRISWMNDAFEHESTPLSLAERFISSASLSKLYRVTPEDTDPYFSGYFDLISRFDGDVEIDYHRQALETEEFSDELKGFITRDLDQRELAEARRSLRRRLSLLLDSQFGRSFGSTRPLESILTMRQQIHDYSRLKTASPQTIPLLMSLIMDVRDWADAHQIHELAVEWEPFDESDALLRQHITAKRLLQKLKTIRGLSKVVGLSIHRLQDAYAIGEHDSELRGIILDILEEFEIVLIGGLKGKRARDMVAEWKDLPPHVMRKIATQGPGDFCVYIEGRDPFNVNRPLNPTLKTITASNVANRRKVERDRERAEKEKAEQESQDREEG